MNLAVMLLITLFLQETKLFSQSETGNDNTLTVPKKDSFKVQGNISATGIIQTGKEKSSVTSLLSIIVLGNSNYQFEPLTSIAYNAKAGKNAEGEYLQNLVVRYHQKKWLYPAAGFSFEKSFLRKIDSRWSGAVLIIFNVLREETQVIKVGVGYNHDFIKFIKGAFNPSSEDDKIAYTRNADQLYFRLKGKNNLLKKSFVFSYDFYYQPAINDFNDYRWTLISNLDLPITKRFDFRTSVISSYETFVATDVANYNLRLTYGISVKF